MSSGDGVILVYKIKGFLLSIGRRFQNGIIAM
jgi:hypothetical protein